MTTLVVDNGSTDGSVAAIRRGFPEVPIIENQQNLGFAGGNNVGIRWALTKPFDWIFLLNNDTRVAPDLFESLLAAARAQPNAKILGAKILKYQDPNRIDHLGGAWDPKRAEFFSLHSGLEDRHDIPPAQVDYVCGAALLMHRSVPETIGLLEEKFFLFWEETDFCFRARRKGFEVWTAPQARVWHKVASSFVGGKPHSHYFWWRSRLLWLERNIPYAERQLLMSEIVSRELWKTARHYGLRLLQKWLRRITLRPSRPDLEQKIRLLKAGLRGAFDYSRGRFGDCPDTNSKK
jgi:GT2 family glycosyltransferase